MRSSLVLLTAATLTACARAPVIERAQVERVVTALAADSMLGRLAFSPSADRAAAFISAEFANIGLERFDGADGYLQAFPVYSFEPGRSTVALNGRTVPPDRAIVSLSADSIRWSTGDSVRVVTVGPTERPLPAVGAALQRGENTLVLVHSTHRAAFERMRSFLSGPRRSVERVEAGNRVLVLTGETTVRSYRVIATASVSQVVGANVVGVLPGRRRDELVLFSAHYDHVGTGPSVSGDTIFNGANDDASGTTAVIELARYFKAKGRPERTLVFAAFTAEEAGGFGSRYFSRRVRPGQIVAMLNIEMIGKPSAQGPNHAWITGFDRSSLGAILREAVAGTEFSFDPDPYPQEDLFYRSDNATLARLGVPAHSVSTTPIDVDRDYHQVSDEVSTLDLDQMTNAIRAIARGAAPIIAGEATPTRVDTTQVRR